jgi:hypothetical protein
MAKKFSIPLIQIEISNLLKYENIGYHSAILRKYCDLTNKTYEYKKSHRVKR